MGGEGGACPVGRKFKGRTNPVGTSLDFRRGENREKTIRMKN